MVDVQALFRQGMKRAEDVRRMCERLVAAGLEGAKVLQSKNFTTADLNLSIVGVAFGQPQAVGYTLTRDECRAHYPVDRAKERLFFLERQMMEILATRGRRPTPVPTA